MISLLLLLLVLLSRWSLMDEGECMAYVKAKSLDGLYSTIPPQAYGSYANDCMGCTQRASTVSFNWNPNAGCTSPLKTVCKANCAPTSTGAALYCHVCEAGKFLLDGGKGPCEDCPIGKYADEPMTAQTCKSCQDGKTSATGAKSCPYLTGDYYITVLCMPLSCS